MTEYISIDAQISQAVTKAEMERDLQWSKSVKEGDARWQERIVKAVAEERERIESLVEIEAKPVFEFKQPNDFGRGYQQAVQNILAALRKVKP